MKQHQFKQISDEKLEKISGGGDFLKDLGDYWSGVVSGIKSVFFPKK